MLGCRVGRRAVTNKGSRCFTSMGSIWSVRAPWWASWTRNSSTPMSRGRWERMKPFLLSSCTTSTPSIRWLSPGNVKTVESKSPPSAQVTTCAPATGRSKLSERKLRQQLKMANSPQSASHTNGKGISFTTPTQSAIQTRLDITPAPRPCIVLEQEEDDIFTTPKRGLSEVDVEDVRTDADESPSKRPRTARAQKSRAVPSRKQVKGGK
ncbi:hypothetical protein B0T18DRAFT_409449 [Schizothecium vesticola]|uniref:Uncharacterized protein n=1 Tax=Schizothecium vesticola TaxID=314040 RepID=A0AA40K4D2_9PEZI|nr:hypothetical protein B0T18DRAFT_409449 [Schizothecium vesticola]